MKKNELIIGKTYKIHSYKHDSKIHRAWNEAILLEINDDFLVFGNNKTKVTESDGRSWKTREPAILFFFYNKWYNIIGQYYGADAASGSPCIINSAEGRNSRRSQFIPQSGNSRRSQFISLKTNSSAYITKKSELSFGLI